MNARFVAVAAGIWLMVSPAVLDYGDPARSNDLLIGPLVASFAVVAIWEATRSLRWFSVLAGAWLLLAPWVIGYSTEATINSIVVGLIAAGSGLAGGEISKQIGGGWTSLWKENAT